VSALCLCNFRYAPETFTGQIGSIRNYLDATTRREAAAQGVTRREQNLRQTARQDPSLLVSDPIFGYDARSLTAWSLLMSEINKERFMSDIKTVLADAEDLLKQAATATGERASELRETALTRLKQAKEKAADAQVVVIERGKKAARATDDYVHEHPWASIGIAAGIGLVIGLWINRK
jgi:ElaB/YqjD/DUF883 family membrane-anchored ribosome-binding protein